MAPYAPAPGRAPGCVPFASNRSRRRASCRSAGVSRAAKPVISDASGDPGMITGCLRRITPQTTRDQGSTDARGDGRDWCYWSERSQGRGAKFRSRFRPRFRLASGSVFVAVRWQIPTYRLRIGMKPSLLITNTSPGAWLVAGLPRHQRRGDLPRRVRSVRTASPTGLTCLNTG